MRLRSNKRKTISKQKTGPVSRAPRCRRAASLLLLLLLVLGMGMLVLTGCVSQEEIDAAMAARPNATTPGEPMTQEEPGGGDEAGGAAGLLDKLADMLGSRSQSLQIIALLTILSLAPSILIMLTGFVRIVMVLSFVRNAIGMQQMPPNQVVIGLALFLTLFVMSPVVDEIKTEAYLPYVTEQITLDEALDRGAKPLRAFMLRQTRSSDLNLFCSFAGEEMPATEEEALEVSMRTLIPAFLTSELKRAFEIGFFIYIPFIVVDMVVASTLMAMGMMMLPPSIISLPLKVLLFVVVDGWQLTIQSLVSGFL